jgi:5-formyltetrahydrofolate cyclo-ligase
MNKQMMKQGLRQSIIAARQNMAAAERAECSREITLKLLNLPSYRDSQTVLGYMSFGAEFETGVWVQQVLRDGKQVLLPRVNSNTKQLELFQVVDLQQDVAPGKWDIPEPLPQRCRRVDDSERIDFILLPGVAFARDGSRLGYGGGFYDKLLERICLDAHRVLPHPSGDVAASAALHTRPTPGGCNPSPMGDLLAGSCPLRSGSAVEEGTKAMQPVLVAAAFSMQLVVDVPQEATDRKVEWLITEHEVINCRSGQKWLDK